MKKNYKGDKRGKSQNRGKSQSKGRNDSRTCYYCLKGGHFIKDCHKRIRDEKNNPKNYDSDNGEAAIAANNSNMGEVLTVSTQDHKEDWILDSGCTFHMCPTRD